MDGRRRWRSPGSLSSASPRTPGAAAKEGEEIRDLVEQARLRDMPLREFISRASRYIRARNHLLAQADHLDSRPGTQPVAIEVEEFGLITAVKRWEGLGVLRDERQRLLELAATEVAEIEGRLRTHLPLTIHQAHGSDPNQGWHTKGLIASHDQWLRSYGDAFTRRGVLLATIARLGRGKAETGRAASAAVALLGSAKVAATIAPRMVADRSRVEQIGATLNRLEEQMSEVDNRTALWKQLEGQRVKAEADLKEAERGVEQARLDSASRVVGMACGGGLGDVLALEKLTAFSPARAVRAGGVSGIRRRIAADARRDDRSVR